MQTATLKNVGQKVIRGKHGLEAWDTGKQKAFPLQK